jgi:hypothetical protein
MAAVVSILPAFVEETVTVLSAGFGDKVYAAVLEHSPVLEMLLLVALVQALLAMQ